MSKKGQVTIFVVLGIVIVVLVALFLVGRQTIFLPTTPENLGEILSDIEEQVQSCIADPTVTSAPIVQLGLQGGYLSPGPDTFRIFNDTQISYLCYNMDRTTTCRNRMLLVSDMERQLNDALKPRILECVGDLEGFGRLKPVDVITEGDLQVDTQVLQETILVNVNYPIVVASTRDENRVSKNVFREVLDFPLGDLYNALQTVIDQETTIGEFDPLLYMLSKRGEHIVIKQRPYPDKLYTITRNDHPYVFQFFIQGQPS